MSCLVGPLRVRAHELLLLRGRVAWLGLGLGLGLGSGLGLGLGLGSGSGLGLAMLLLLRGGVAWVGHQP